jgi:plastocyanin domain-containing protein
MLNQGFALTGSGFDTNTLLSSNSANNIASNQIVMDGNYQVIKMDVTSRGWEPNTFVLKKGVPVKWIINGKQITGCNNAIVVPKYNLNFDIKQGEQTIEFTPTESGTVPWSCWMGMIKGTFIVTDTGQATQNQITGSAVKNTNSGSSCSMGGGCGGSCGSSCGCGAK